MPFTLAATEVAADRSSWLWRLFDPAGVLVAHHPVSVDTTAWEWRALADLPVGVAQQVDPGDRLASEALLARRVGRWTTEHVLGPVANQLAEEAPVAVSVVVPADAGWLLALPLGAAEVGERSLAGQRVVFAGALDGQRPGTKEPVGGRLRVLAVYSVPAGQSLLDLRRERKGLADLVDGLIGGAGTRAIDLRVLQYGATPERLQDALAEGEGWDVVHFSGHGAAGQLVLEDAAGRPKAVDTSDLVAWLRDARHRLKLVTLSACSSAAFTVAQTLQDLGVANPAVAGSATVEPASHGLALEIVRRAQCTVVAMRYPVVDDFAIAFGLALFEGLWDKQMDAASAVGWAVQRAARFPPTPGAPALSAFTPAVFGPTPDLRLVPPSDTTAPPVDTRMAGFDKEPARFVGRIAVMTRANAVLAPDSGRSGVIFHGMAGAGKTACGLELAYGQRANFAKLIWCKCPLEGAEVGALAGALADLAGRLDLALGVALADKVLDPARLAGVLAELTEAMEHRSVLVVIDNAESLLSPTGAWLDPRWEMLVTALAGHAGRGRLVVTSRRPPSPIPAGLSVEAVHALSRDEAVLLARQLPNLARLLQGEPSTEGNGRPVARSVLEASGGHPKLLELADAQAGAGGVLEPMLAGASQVWDAAGVDPSQFLTEGTTGTDPVASYVELLRRWAAQALATLDDATVVMAQLLCHCHPADRTRQVVEANWADVWHRLGRADPVPDHRPLLAHLTGAALVEVTSPESDTESYDIHPLVAETILADVPDEVTAAVDTELAAFWTTVFRQAEGVEGAGGAAGGTIVHAARQGALYLLRQDEWDAARVLLENAVHRDISPARRAEAAQMLRRIAAQAAGTDAELPALAVLARALYLTEPAEAERLLSHVEERAAATDRFQVAGAAATALVNLLRGGGRYDEALAVVGRAIGYTRQAGLGPWTQLLDQITRLQLLGHRGENEQVLAELAQLDDEMAGLPDPLGENEAAIPWNVRELLFATAVSAAQDLGRWSQSLAWLDKVLASKRARGAGELEEADTSFNAYGSLLRTGRTIEARSLLEGCRAVFETYGAHSQLAQCLSAQADIEDESGHGHQAIELEQIALRFEYVQPVPANIAVSHNNLAVYLARWTDDSSLSICHQLAATILSALTRSGLYARNRQSLARTLAAGTPPPADFAALCDAVEQVEGVAFRRLVQTLGGEGEHLLASVLAEARALPAEELYAEPLAAWEATLALLVAATDGNVHARSHLDEHLDRRSLQAAWTALAERLGLIRDGERNPDTVGQNLDPIDTAIVARAIDALAGRVRLDPAPEFLRTLVAEVLSLSILHRSGAEAAETASAVDAALEELAGTEDWARLAVQLRALATGGTGINCDDLDGIDTAILATALRQLEKGDGP